ncbi:hypothetical protein KIPB_009424 [Kipferlia bialata]|uniref:N-acetyltransferase domain-containing protein n=1 Tax=Kipferlia bialata TaxID=797122 RepID=A0A391NNV6_9EUKA|nr:hypothetical protein KIPB_009424 [Kipferlia bialata]|eukprot:g9424.t1
MELSHRAMVDVHQADYCSLHVRESNVVASHLYRKTLAYDEDDVEVAYYADGEDAHKLIKWFTEKREKPAKDEDKKAEAAPALPSTDTKPEAKKKGGNAKGHGKGKGKGKGKRRR